MRWTWTLFWAAAGLAMLVSQLWVRWFVIDFTYFKVNLGWIALVYSGLTAYLNVRLRTEIQLTDRELHDWGDVFIQVTPLIIEMASQGVRPREIAARLEKERSLPPLVSMKYMAALEKATSRTKHPKD